MQFAQNDPYSQPTKGPIDQSTGQPGRLLCILENQQQHQHQLQQRIPNEEKKRAASNIANLKSVKTHKISEKGNQAKKCFLERKTILARAPPAHSLQSDLKTRFLDSFIHSLPLSTEAPHLILVGAPRHTHWRTGLGAFEAFAQLQQQQQQQLQTKNSFYFSFAFQKTYERKNP